MLPSFPYSFEQSQGVSALQGIIFWVETITFQRQTTNNAAFDEIKLLTKKLLIKLFPLIFNCSNFLLLTGPDCTWTQFKKKYVYKKLEKRENYAAQ